MPRQEARKQDIELGLGAAEVYERSAGEELTQCVYNKIESIISDCNSAWRYIQ
jgi:hypothetical protein